LDQALLYQLPRLEDVGPRLEDQLDPRQPGNRFGADPVEPCHPVEQVLLERDGDQLLDLGGGQPERLGLDLDHRRVELGKCLHRHAAKLHKPEEQQRHGDKNDQEPELQARSDDPSHHG